MTEYLNLDGPRVSRDAALELMVHHLQLAHSYFQNTIEDVVAKRDEARRLFNEAKGTFTRWVDDGGMGYAQELPADPDSPEIVAGMEWLDRMEEIYEEMCKDNP